MSPDAKTRAREQAAAAVSAGGYGRREVVIRINSLSTAWGSRDIAAVARAAPHAVLVPKVETVESVLEVRDALIAAGAHAAVPIWCMLETPLGILNAQAIARASPAVGALVMGTSDLTKELHARHTRDRQPVMTSLGLCVLAARAARITALDGVHLDLDDDAGFAAACRQAADMGFDGKTLIHPKQIAEANAAFGPTDEDLAWARRVVTAHAEARAAGRLVENLHVDEAHRVIALHRAIQG